MASNNPFTSAQAPAQQNVAMQLVAPELAAQQISLARQQQIAQLLREKGMTDEGGTEVVSGWAVPKSGMQGLSRLASALMGGYLQKTADEKNMELQKAFANKLRDVATGGSSSVPADMAGGASLPGGAAGTDQYGSFPVGAVPGEAGAATAPVQAAPGRSPDNYNMANLIRGQAIEMLGGDNAGKNFWADKATTEMEKNNRYLGITQQQAQAAELAKMKAAGMLNMRQGSTTRDLSTGEMFTAPDQDTGTYLEWKDGRPVVSAIPGADAAMASRTRAQQEGKNAATLANPEFLPRNPDGTYNPATISQVIPGGNQVGIQPMGAAPKYADIDLKNGFPPGTMASLEMVESGGNPNAVSKAGAEGRFQMMKGTQRDPGYGLGRLDPNNPEDAAKYLRKMTDLAGGSLEGGLAKYNAGPGGNPDNPETRAYVPKVMAGIPKQAAPAVKGAGVPFGMKESAEGNVKLANDTYQKLSDTNTNAPQVLSALDTMDQNVKGAIVGGAAEKRQYLNSLASIIPGFDASMDAKTKTDLLNKSANRLVLAGTNTSGATDAMRTLAEAASPNSKMSLDAIKKASLQLKAYVQIGLDNQRILEQDKVGGDFNSVNKKHLEFTRNADARLWELKNMDAASRAKYLEKLSADELAELSKKGKIIKQLGGLSD